MDNPRFDDLTRALGGATTRRAGLWAALGGLLGMGLGLGSGMAALPPADAEAKKRHRKRKKTRNSIACTPNSAEKPCPSGTTCLALDPDRPNEGRCMCTDGALRPPCGSICCPEEATCSSTGADGTCRCGNGYPPCAGRCCAAGETCSYGTCMACPAGQTPCGSACCFGYQTCQNGICVGCSTENGSACAIDANCCGSGSVTMSCQQGRCCRRDGNICYRDSNCCSGRCVVFGDEQPNRCGPA